MLPGMANATTLEVRNLRFDVEADVPRHWHTAGRSITSFFDALSTFFPEGERFFVASVHAHREVVTDPVLREAVRGFCGQEGFHGREHRRYNEMLQRQGYPADALEKEVEQLLARVQARVPRRLRLAATCALEHFTALMAQVLLGDPRMLEGAHPTMAALWRWHAAEENEHKSGAYDVFLAAGGTYTERVTAMVGASIIFWAKVVEHQARLMRADGTHLSPREWLALGNFLFVRPGTLRRIIPAYLRYYVPGFHPRDVDSDALVEEWRREHAAVAVS
jgi:predicted metal-dependent hydrolase